VKVGDFLWRRDNWRTYRRWYWRRGRKGWAWIE